MMIFILRLLTFISVSISNFAWAEVDPFLGQWESSDRDARYEVIFEEGKYIARILSVDDEKFWNEKINKERILQKKVSELPKAVGTKMIWGLERTSKTELKNGTVKDPESGRDANAKAELKDNELKFRFYIGSPLFGLTQTWRRIKPASTVDRP
jgi:uncharacterized protein (DUF2147 family)